MNWNDRLVSLLVESQFGYGLGNHFNDDRRYRGQEAVQAARRNRRNKKIASIKNVAGKTLGGAKNLGKGLGALAGGSLAVIAAANKYLKDNR